MYLYVAYDSENKQYFPNNINRLFFVTDTEPIQAQCIYILLQVLSK
jgi:hypothetical protein